MKAALTYLHEILKKEATIALPRHDGENPKNSFSPFVFVLIVVLHSVSLGKLSLSQDLHWITLHYEIIIKLFFLTWHCNFFFIYLFFF